MDSIKELRSFCRKQYKIGDKIELMCANNGRWERSPLTISTAAVETAIARKPVPFIDDTPIVQNNAQEDAAFETGPPQQDATSWSQQPRWVVDLSSTSEAERCVVVRDSRIWSMKECQQHQLKFIAPRKQQKRKQEQPSTKMQKPVNGRTIDNSEISAKEKHRNGIENDLNDNDSSNNNTNTNNKNNGDGGLGGKHHGGGKEKRLQAQELVAFFVKIVGSKVVVVASNEKEEQGNSLPPTIEQRKRHDELIRDWFNRADGVLDVAGGCGHVSMALGIEGISSTVVDARATVGKLPKRDRKIWKKSLRQSLPRIPTNNRKGRSNDDTAQNDVRLPPPTHHLSQYEYCQPVIPAPAVVPFQSQQAWFGSKPVGYDASFRHPNDADIPVLVATAAPKNDTNNSNNSNSNSNSNIKNSNVSKGSTQGEHAEEEQTNISDGIVSLASNNHNDSAALRRRVSALVALHPDEATGEIVEQAVKHRIPFVVVPCCVFARLFPNRKTNDGKPVSSYEDLLDFLQEQDPSIQRTEMSFGGKNIALWSVFPDG